MNPDFGQEMSDSPSTLLWLFLASLVAGAVNAIAGGGTLLTFPSLLSVVDPIAANATSTVALVPGSFTGAWGYRRELRGVRRWLLLLIVPSLAGGWVGATLVTELPAQIFARLVPWLILTATLLFLVQPLVARLRRNLPSESPTVLTQGGVICFQFVVAVYGGYFGAGIGILMLSALAFMGISNIHQMNALKTALAVCINGVAVLKFIIEGKVVWWYALWMAAGAIVGGYLGARFALRIRPLVVRWIVIGIGFGLAAHYFYVQWAG